MKSTRERVDFFFKYLRVFFHVYKGVIKSCNARNNFLQQYFSLFKLLFYLCFTILPFLEPVLEFLISRDPSCDLESLSQRACSRWLNTALIMVSYRSCRRREQT